MFSGCTPTKGGVDQIASPSFSSSTSHHQQQQRSVSSLTPSGTRHRLLGLFNKSATRPHADSSSSQSNSGGVGSPVVGFPSSDLPPLPRLETLQEDSEERRELIEKAASERDEKRKKKVTEALLGTQRRLDVAFNAIQAEMDETIETSKWTTEEKKSALLVFVVISFAHAYGVVSYLACIGLMGYSYRQSSLRHIEAKRAGDNVGARLADLEDGLRRCELALQHDVEQEEEWTQMVLEETRQWEERQKELLVRRGRAFPYTQRINTQRIRMVTQFHETTDRAMQALHKIEDVARKTLMPLGGGGGGGNTANPRESAEESLASEMDLATPAWKHYVLTNLPLERLAVESPEEQEFSAQLRIKSQGDWDLLPKDLQLMILRGYADKKDRMKDSLDGLKYIIDWRKHTKCDTILTTATPEHQSFFNAWGTVYAGEDKYGHLIIADRVEAIDLHALFLLEDDFILEMRTKQMEVLRRLKRNIEQRRGVRVCKHIYILDLSGLNVRKHFAPRVKNLLQSIFKVGGDAYPDSMWQMWLINTPFVFQLIWKVLSPTIEPTTKAKIRMLGGKDKYLPEMQKCGIPLESIPAEFGGECTTHNFFHALQEIIRTDQDQQRILQQASMATLPNTNSVNSL
ncbi:hypothetical protein BASA81_011029 [Batrachochytrium salamandrivorans]|nr:hypothetical protein BASA81_011029 [Batrachochytrium salamandrivorans]